MKSVGFLDLSSDIRNRIYRIATHDANHVVEMRVSRRTTSAVEDAFFRARGCYGFTQTCRQVRTELRPMYLRERSISVHLRDANDYLETVYSSGPIERGVSNGWLTVRTDSEHKDDYPRKMQPLLRLLVNTPGLQFRFTEGEGPSVFNNAFVRHESAWKVALDNDIKFVSIDEPSFWGLMLVLNPNSPQPWLKDCSRAWTRILHMPDASLEYFRGLGLNVDSDMIFVRRGTSSKMQDLAREMASSHAWKGKRGRTDKVRLGSSADAASVHSKQPLLVPDSRAMSVATNVSHSTVNNRT